MKVKDLIAALTAMPQDADVIQRGDSEGDWYDTRTIQLQLDDGGDNPAVMIIPHDD